MIIEDKDLELNRVLLMGDNFLPYGGIMMVPIFKDGQSDEFEEELKAKVKGIGIWKSMVTRTIVGRLCYRKLDNAHSRQYKRILEDYNREPYLEVIQY